MYGLNVVALTGDVGNVTFATTRESGEAVCSFTMAIQKNKSQATWARVNVYGGLVEICRERLKKGERLAVQGELMNRRVREGEEFLTEIRCREIKFI